MYYLFDFDCLLNNHESLNPIAIITRRHIPKTAICPKDKLSDWSRVTAIIKNVIPHTKYPRRDTLTLPPDLPQASVLFAFGLVAF